MNKKNIKLFDTLFASMTCALFLTALTVFFNYRFRTEFSVNDVIKYSIDSFTVTMIAVFIPLLIYNLLISPMLYKYKGYKK